MSVIIEFPNEASKRVFLDDVEQLKAENAELRKEAEKWKARWKLKCDDVRHFNKVADEYEEKAEALDWLDTITADISCLPGHVVILPDPYDIGDPAPCGQSWLEAIQKARKNE